MTVGIVDLNNGATKVNKVEVSKQGRLLAGAGMWSASEFHRSLLSKLHGAECQNVVFINTGPLTGSGVPGSGTWSVTYLSPLTGCFVTEPVVGGLGAKLRYAGLEQLIILGRAKNPVYIMISDDEIKLHDASSIWELTTCESTDAIIHEVDEPDPEVAVIGPGSVSWPGQGLIVNYYFDAGELGLGNLFAKVLLKGIVANGRGKVALAHPEHFLDLCLKICQRCQDDLSHLSGTGRFLSPWHTARCVPVPGEEHKFVLEPFSEECAPERPRQLTGKQLLRLRHFGNSYGIPWRWVMEAIAQNTCLIKPEYELSAGDFWRVMAMRRQPLYTGRVEGFMDPFWIALEAAGLDWSGHFSRKEAAELAAKLLSYATGAPWDSFELEELGIQITTAKMTAGEKGEEKWL